MPIAAAACATLRTALYRRRQPERTVLYRTVQSHLATWLEQAQDETGRSTPAYVEREFRRYLDCGILKVLGSDSHKLPHQSFHRTSRMKPREVR